MASSDKIYPLNLLPGIQRDGTDFSCKAWRSGIWSRFQRGLPQKIGGLKVISENAKISRGITVVPNNPNFHVYNGTASSLTYTSIDDVGNYIAGPIDRTPLLFPANDDNLWSFSSMFFPNGGGSILLATAPPNVGSINNTIERPIYYGEINSNDRLLPTGLKTAGSIVVLQPYLFILDPNGQVRWCEANNPTTVIDSAYPANSKFVAGLPTRAGIYSPGGLFWTLDSVIRVTNVGTSETTFSFDTISAEASILSSQSVVEYDNVYYWCGVDRFLVYNGVVDELPNNYSIDFFFKNLNYAHSEKVWAAKVTKYGEIWWHFPYGDATECNWAVIYNIRQKTWYDTPCNFGAGYFSQLFSNPIWSGNTLEPDGDYHTFITEEGTDHVDLDGSVTSIPSSISSSDFSYVSSYIDGGRNELNRLTEIVRIEPDFILSGNLQITANTRSFPNSTPTTTVVASIDSTTEKVDCRIQGRIINLTFTSDEVGGYYEMGQLMIVGRPGDVKA